MFVERILLLLILAVAQVIAPFGVAKSQTATDQIAIVIPAVQRGSADLSEADAALISFILAQNIKRYFQRNQGVHRSALVTIPAQLPNNKLASISTLARINGAQLAVFMKAFQQLDGALISTVMVIPERYRDFRSQTLEVIDLNYKGRHIRLDVPGRYMVFPSLFLSANLLQTYKDGTYRDICPIDRCDSNQPPKVVGNCSRLGRDVQFSETTKYIEFARTEALLKFNGICYIQKLPENAISQPVIDFVAGVERFFVGDWPVARDRMIAIVNSKAVVKQDIKLQAYLYLSRIAMRQGNREDAQKFLELASTINDKDPSVLETRQFLYFWLLIQSIESDLPDRKAMFERAMTEVEKLPKILQRPYLPFLEALKSDN